MARKKRMESIGYYHILNRGVARRDIYLDDEDHLTFLEILDESAETYGFEIYAYALMDNHYHLLLKTSTLNLSLLMRQINARYSMYFNKKYKRVGPLWQGRFKSWYVYDEGYLNSLVKYIEFNPVKAKTTSKVGQYRWTMSAKIDTLGCLNYKLIDAIDLKKKLSKAEQQEVATLMKTKVVEVNGFIVPETKKELKIHFEKSTREFAIASAIKDGYTQQEIANYLELSNIAISKIYKTYRQKVLLFNALRDKGIFWSYAKTIQYEEAGEELFVEYLYKYADFDDIRLAFELFGKRRMKYVWEKRLVSDKRFKKLNFMIARIFFGMDIEAKYFDKAKNERFEKFKMLAS